MTRIQRLLIPPVLAILLLVPASILAGPGTGAASVWQKYVDVTEARIERDFRSPVGFLNIELRNPQTVETRRKLKAGDVHIEKIRNGAGDDFKIDGAMIHHWIGAVFIPKSTLDQVLAWVQNYDEHQRRFKDVERSQLIRRSGDTFEVYLRLVRTKVITVRYDTNHTAMYRRHDSTHASSKSVATRIVEDGEPGKDSGFLWRMNSYWRFSAEDNGVFVECESLSLSRSIPFGLEWLIGKYLDSVPRESLEDTLNTIRKGVTESTPVIKETRR